MKTTVKTKPGKRLTKSQNLLLFWIVDKITDAMVYDHEEFDWKDCGNIVLKLSENQLEELHEIKSKLIEQIDLVTLKTV